MHIAVLDSGEPGDGTTFALSTIANIQARLVLTVLTVEAPRLVRADEMAEVLWPDRLPKTWDTMVRGAVAKVRRALDQAGLDPLATVQSAGGGYRLVLPADWSIDVHQARRALDGAEQAILVGDFACAAEDAAAAAAIVVGHDLLADLDGEWLASARRALRLLGTDAIQLAATAELSLGNHRRAIVLARQLVDLEPFGEPAYQILMQALAADGDRARALQVYNDLRSLLRAELGIAPSLQTESVHRSLRESSQGRATADPLERSTVTPTGIIGRESEQAQLLRAWDRATSGKLTLALVSGEAGIGKTTLVLHAAHQAWTQHAAVLVGRCSANPAIAYEPVVEAITAHAEACDGATRQRLLDAAGPALGWIVPSLSNGLDDITPSSDPDRDRLLLFEAVTAYLGAATAISPTVLLLDDVQWAGATTWSLLDHVVRRLPSAPLLVIMTERRPEVVGPRLAEIVATWRRSPGLDEIELTGWTAEEARAFVLAAATDADVGSTDTDALAESLRERAGGNPYFISELLRATGSTSMATQPSTAVPRGIVDIVVHHMQRSGVDATLVMQSLAVIGVDAGSQLLRRVCWLEPDAFGDAVDAALATGLVRERPGRTGRFAFAHALAREAVLVGFPAGLRSRMHERVAEELERLRDQGAAVTDSDLAHHFSFALGRADRALAYSIQAAKADLATGARDEAAARLRRALDLDPSDRSRLDALLLLGLTLAQQGEGSESSAVFVRASALARALNDPRALATAAIGLTTPGRGVTTWVAEPARDAMLQSALRALGDHEDALRVKLLGALSDAIVDPGSWEQRQRLAEEAVEIAARSTEPAAIIASLGASRVAWWRPDQTELRLAAAERVLAVATAQGDDEAAAAAALARVADLVVIGDRERVHDALATARRIVERVDMVRFHWALQLIEAGQALSDGHLAEADAAATRAFTVWGTHDQPDARRAFEEQAGFGILAANDVALLTSSLDTYLEAINRAAAYRCLLPCLLVAVGRTDQARTEIERIAAEDYRTVPAHSSWLFALATLADAAAVTGPAAVVAHLRAELVPHGGRMVHLEGPSITWGCVDHRLGVLAFAAGDLDAATPLLRSALAQHTSFGARPWSWRSSMALAEVLRATGSASAADEADELLRSAATEAESMGMPGLQRAAVELLSGVSSRPCP